LKPRGRFKSILIPAIANDGIRDMNIQMDK
jgi:hypothetical protein